MSIKNKIKLDAKYGFCGKKKLFKIQKLKCMWKKKKRNVSSLGMFDTLNSQYKVQKFKKEQQSTHYYTHYDVWQPSSTH